MEYKKAIKLKANAALITVIGFLGVFTTIGLSLLIQTTDFSVTSSEYYRRSIVENYLKSCLDESIYQIDQNNNFSGEIILEFEEGQSNCTANVSQINQTEFDISITANRTNSNNSLSQNYNLNISGDSFNLTKE